MNRLLRYRFVRYVTRACLLLSCAMSAVNGCALIVKINTAAQIKATIPDGYIYPHDSSEQPSDNG